MLIELVRSLFDLFTRRQMLARCPVRVRTCVRGVLLICVAASGRLSIASIAQSGDVTPADNPFTLNVNEGIPNGNSWNIFEAINHQTFFEGRHVDGSNPPTNDTNVNFDVVVGKTNSGTLLISGESALRDQDLVIGGDPTSQSGTTQRAGSGVVRITGFGSLYNNDPNILPAELIDPNTGQPIGGFQSQTPRLKTTGFDVLVGYTGNGTLEITAGARAEIQDAVVVGDNTGAVGNLVVDGIDSFLGSGGLNAVGGGGGGNGSGNRTTFHQMIIGRQGSGNMTISTGATVVSEAPASNGGGGNTNGVVGAALGSSPFLPGAVQDAGGNGIATVTGPGSKWTIGGSLQIGGFDIGSTGQVLSTVGDAEGDDTAYVSQMGRGTLYVNDGGQVQVRNAIGVASTDTTTPLQLLIGHFGTVQLNGGTIRIGNANTSGGGGSTDQGIPDSVQVVNDGVITGTGRIETGGFRNRYFGEVRVNAGQSLVIDAGAQFAATGGSSTVPEPLINYGKINVLGTVDSPATLEFVRSPSAGASTTTTVRPFINQTLPFATIAVTPGKFAGGQISAQHANLIFGSGLENHGVLAFTAGTNNVSGRVVNIFSGPDTDEPDGDFDDVFAQVLVSGPGTKAVFQNDLKFGPIASLNISNGGNVVVENQSLIGGMGGLTTGGFVMAGTLDINLSYSNPSLITVAGNVGIGTTTSALVVNLDADVLHSLKHGDAFRIIAFDGLLGNVDMTNPLDPNVDLSKFPLFSRIQTSPNIKTLYGLDTVVDFSNQGVYVEFLNPMAVGGGAGAMGPDFNGDGKVDAADLAIWKAHVGITSGASVLEGDANGDGKVDGQDFLMWQRNVGKPKPWFGSGATVPEPASLAMLLCAASIGLAFSRRRCK
jgi:T5SS/PEP-CTERM-associated repeat protein